MREGNYFDRGAGSRDILDMLCLSESRKLPADVDRYSFVWSDIRPDYFSYLVRVSYFV